MKHNILNTTVLCILGILINFAGNTIASALEIPLFLDAIGTMLAAAVGGYLPGTIVGLGTNLITGILDVTQFSYGFLNIMIAILTVFFADRKYFEKFWKALLTVPAYVAVCAGVSAVVAWLLEEDAAVDIFSHLLSETEDKGISVLITFCILKLLPPYIYEVFCPPQEAAVSSREKPFSRLKSLRTRLILMLGTVSLLIAGTVTGVSFYQFRETTISEHARFAECLTDLMAAEMDAEKIDEYIELGTESQEYREIKKSFSLFMSSYPDVKFLYVYRMLEDGIQVVFDMDVPEIPGDPPGTLLSYDESFRSILPDLLAGKEVTHTISSDEYGYMLTIYKPIYNQAGECQCYACIDFSMNILAMYNRTFIARVVTMFLGFVFLIFAVGLRILETKIILPVNHMAYCAGTFAYDSEEERAQNVERIRRLNIHTGDEIENLYRAFLKTTEDSMQYVDSLRKAEKQVSQISETAYRDALTGVKNKGAYDNMKASLQGEIAHGFAEFAIVMADLNHLKQVNDEFGHKKGDIYITGACHMICTVYQHSPVYRVGGDEFIIVLTGQDYRDRRKLFNEITQKFAETDSNASAEPWERFSAAFGMAEYSNISNETVEQVFNRADKQMYDNKIRMKKNRTV